MAYISPSGDGTTFASWRDYVEEMVLGQLDQECLTRNSGFWYEPNMIGFQARALINYWNIAKKDPRIPPAIQACADTLYSHWQANFVGAWPYGPDQEFTNQNLTSAATTTGVYCTAARTTSRFLCLRGFTNIQGSTSIDKKATRFLA